MLFTDLQFLFYFLPAALIVHRLALVGKNGPGEYPYRARLAVFLLTLVFYGYREPKWLLPLGISIGFDFLWATLLSRTSAARARTLLLFASIAQNLSLLGYFKYVSDAGAPPGISFYTFESLSFVIDVYRREVPCPKHPLEFFAFIGMFPRFIAGPIVRYKEMSGQFANYSGMRWEPGLYLFAAGFFLKSVFADNFALFVPLAFDHPEKMTWAGTWVGVFAYAMQLYFDFSGYSLMAIGLGKCLGFEFPTNFDRPYLATNLGEFWRRWHISLSNWMRDYLFNPLAMWASRTSPWLLYPVLWLTMVLIGLWHGPRWTYILMGAWHGFFLCLERITRSPRRLPTWLHWPFTFLVTMVGWVFFRAEGGVSEVGTILSALFFPGPDALTLATNLFAANPVALFACAVGTIYVFAIEPRFNWTRFQSGMTLDLPRAFAMSLMLALSLKLDAVATTIPFLYFQF